ncbi:uncharacterized protein LOC112524189 [Cynara cardunculus var. scolymus]|uniref:uncharacterized protein LOC112524189 n=1 Tax=Cynara cardunculus var. scolymus TaxID=59895 RepID=UPI000D62FC3C|nr:uncharacterized protein LOC112524189 [Cynara cardunculus var. scolymus]
MDSGGAAAKPWTPKLTLENYLLLEHLDVIAPSILQKIIRMHGFNSSKVPKIDLMDAVRSINLMDAQHSTLQNDGVSSHAFLSLKDVINDLSGLRWQECCITSLQTINSVIGFSTGVDTSIPQPLRSNGNLASGWKDIEDEAAASSIVTDSGAVGGSTSMKVPEDSEGLKTQAHALKRSKLASLPV